MWCKRFLCMIIVLGIVEARASAAEPAAVGRTIGAFKLHDVVGREYDSSQHQHAFHVVAFLGTECPLARMYGPRLAELAKRFEGQDVEFITINSNQQDTLIEIAHFARVSRIEFPCLKDPLNEVADAFGAKRTPEVFVLDRNRAIRYHGRIDDQFGIGFSRKEPARQDLALALDELLAGKEVTVPETPTTGCHIGRVNRIKPHGDVTYATQIAAIIQKNCVVCHRTGEIGPFTLTSYEDVRNWSSTIREVVSEQRMPPWHATTEAGHFVNDRRMSDDDKKLLFDWIDHGMPAGPMDQVPKPQSFEDGWQIAKPDLVLEMAEAYTVPAKGTVEYQYFPLKATFETDTWVSASEARPGNRSVVHHLILFYVPPGHKGPVQEASLRNSIATFAPGIPAWQAPTGMARRIPAGSKLYFQAHYTPNGVEAKDLSRAGLVLADAKQVEKELHTDAVVNFRLKIPPRTDDVKFKANHGFGRDVRLVSLLPHMHLRGKSFRIESVDSFGERKLLLDVPRYDFNWQNSYVFADPILMREGSQLICSASYDNSDKNPSNPDPNATVGWGDQTWEEMMVAQFETVWDDQDLRRGRPTVREVGPDQYAVTFSYRPQEKVDAVYLAGVFNDWKPDDLKMEGPDKDGTFTRTLSLKPGMYEYKFVLNGKTWRNDPGNPDVIGDYRNNVLRIEK